MMVFGECGVLPLECVGGNTQAAMVPGPICAKCRAIYIARRKSGISYKAQAVSYC